MIDDLTGSWAQSGVDFRNLTMIYPIMVGDEALGNENAVDGIMVMTLYSSLRMKEFPVNRSGDGPVPHGSRR